MRIPTVLLAAAFVGACGDAADDTARRDEAAQLGQSQIQRLAERYPRLRDEPLPEPQPAPAADPSAAPAGVPAKVHGEATFYANMFEGRRTASGIPFRHNQMVAAHRAYPFGTILRVTNLGNDRSVNVRVVDRGPFGGGAHAQRTILDLSRRAAQELGYVDAGRARVRVEVLEWGRGVGAA